MEIFTYLPSAQASFMPWSDMAEVRFYIQVLVFTGKCDLVLALVQAWVARMKAAECLVPKELVNAQKLHTHPLVVVGHMTWHVRGFWFSKWAPQTQDAQIFNGDYSNQMLTIWEHFYKNCAAVKTLIHIFRQSYLLGLNGNIDINHPSSG